MGMQWVAGVGGGRGVWRVMDVVVERVRGSSAAWTLGRFWGASQSFSDSGTVGGSQWEGWLDRAGSVWGGAKG